MKKMYNYLKFLPILLLGSNQASAQLSTFSMTGSVQTYTVPVGVTQLTIDAKGASGGDYAYGIGVVGDGGEISSLMTVVPGQIIYVYVGGMGTSGSYYGGGVGGWNGGGNTTGTGGGGGGASDLRTGGTTLADRVLVAGGGGGTGNAFCFYYGGAPEKGGDAGGLTGENGYDNSAPYAFAPGGDQTGASGGTLGIGGDAGLGTRGGAGGGGYYGGVGGFTSTCYSYYGGGNASGGGGGSSYADPAMTSVVFGPSTNVGNGVVTICAPGVAGTIISGPVCVGASTTFTNPTGTVGGIWSSSNPAIATVGSLSGIVTGVGPGSVTITRTVTTPCGNATTSVVITVNPAPSAIIGPFGVCVGSTITLSDATPGGTWTSVNTTVATIGSSTGTVSGLVVGNSQISYQLTATGCVTTATVNVKPLPLPIVGPSDACVGYTQLYTDPSPFGTWSSSFPAAGSIDPTTGILTGIAGGATQISYIVNGCAATMFVTFHYPPFPITGTSPICQGNSTALTEFGFGGVWSSDNTTIATVDPTGLVDGIGGGLANISYTVVGCPPATFPMTVNTISPITGMTSACIGIAVALTDTTTGGSWSSSDTLVATISSTGLVTAVSFIIGSTATISYTLPSGCLTTHPIVINMPPMPIVGPDSVCLGSSATMSDATPSGTWTSTDLAIAQIVDTTGLTTGVSPGVVNLSYTLTNGCYQTKSFLVETPVPQLINITRYPPDDTVCLGTTVKFFTAPTNGGVLPHYKWSKFGVAMGDSVSDSFSYTPIHGDVIVCTMISTGICALTDSVSDSITFNVDSNKSPLIAITNSTFADTLDYLGQKIDFFSETHYGGVAPQYQWYRNGKAISGATNSSYSALVYQQDTFYCTVIGNPPCGTSPTNATSNKIIIYNRLGVKTIANGGNTLSLFPNPNDGNLTLTGKVDPASNNDITMQVTDMLGHVVYTAKAVLKNGVLNEAIKLDNNLANGTYLLHVSSDAGSDVFHFVVNR